MLEQLANSTKKYLFHSYQYLIGLTVTPFNSVKGFLSHYFYIQS